MQSVMLPFRWKTILDPSGNIKNILVVEKPIPARSVATGVCPKCGKTGELMQLTHVVDFSINDFSVSGSLGEIETMCMECFLTGHWKL